MHPRLSVNQLSCFDLDLVSSLSLCDEVGIDQIGLAERTVKPHGWEDAITILRSRGMRVSSVLCHEKFDLVEPSSWPASRASIDRSLDAAAELGAACVYITTGRAGRRTWEELLDAFADAIAPCIERATALATPLAFEATSPVRTNISFVHTLADALVVARRTGIHLDVDLANCWMERDLASTFVAGASFTALVQVGDAVLGSTAIPDKVVPGDGDAPLGLLLGQVLAAGYGGPVELEILGPAVEAEGYRAAIERGLRVLSGMLDQLAA